MSGVRPGGLGATRVCPHCKATVLESAAVCPACRHHLRFNAGAAQPGSDDNYTALNIEGTIAHAVKDEACEYCVVLAIRNERGEHVTRQVVGVGALQPGESRSVSVAVEMLPARAQPPAPPPKHASAIQPTAARPAAASIAPPPTPQKPPTAPSQAASAFKPLRSKF
jgi:hypothetical protein